MSSFLPFQSQDLIGNSPFSLPYNSYEIGLENLVLDQLLFFYQYSHIIIP